MLNISLEIARGLAALWVFIYHIRLGIDPGVLRRFADGGFLGVPLFFVISGYCMMASSRGIIAKQQTAGKFLHRRLRRIFPPFWASILVVLAVPFVTSAIHACYTGVFRWPSPRWYEYSLPDWVSLLTLTKGLLVQGQAHKPYSAVCSVYWSLAIEVQFYLVMWLGLAFRRGFNAILIAVTAGAVAFWFFAGPIAPGLFPQYWPMFALGFLLYTVLDKGFRPALLFGRWTRPASAFVFTGLTATAVGLTVYAPSESLARQTLFALFCGSILWAGSGIGSVCSKDLLASRALVGLGKMSYSVYLLHVQVVTLVTIFVRLVVPRSSLLSPVLCVLGTLPLTYVFYHYCEKRFVSQRRPARAIAAEPILLPENATERCAPELTGVS
jgi:peptidoglycan/LPS O-acetylase OafA/YrhL